MSTDKYDVIASLPEGMSELEFWEPEYETELDDLTTDNKEESWAGQTNFYTGLEQMWTRQGW